MNPKNNNYKIIFSLIIVVLIISYLWHPMLKNKALSLSLLDVYSLNGFLLTQEKTLHTNPSEEHKFHVLLTVLKNKDYDNIDKNQILEYFPEKYLEDYFAVLVLYIEDGEYVYARYLTYLNIPLSSQMNDFQMAQTKSIILDYFNNNQEKEGLEYFYNLMYYCAQTGHWLDNSNISYYDDYDNTGYDGLTDYDYDNYNDYSDYGSYDDYSNYSDTYGTNEDDDYDRYEIFDRSDEANPYDRGYEEGYSADSPFDNFHGSEEGYSDAYMDGYSDGSWEAYVDEHSYEQDLDSWEEFFDENYGDFMDEGYDDYSDYDDYGSYDDYSDYDDYGGYDDYGY